MMHLRLLSTQIYKDFGVRLSAGTWILPEDYFYHNLPYTLWSEREGWYIPTASPDSFWQVMSYLSRNPPADVNYDVTAKPYQRWSQITEADIQEWRIQELEDKIDKLERERYYR